MDSPRCLINLFSFYRNVYEIGDNNYDIVYLDFKAFDNVQHEILLTRKRLAYLYIPYISSDLL